MPGQRKVEHACGWRAPCLSFTPHEEHKLDSFRLYKGSSSLLSLRINDHQGKAGNNSPFYFIIFPQPSEGFFNRNVLSMYVQLAVPYQHNTRKTREYIEDQFDLITQQTTGILLPIDGDGSQEPIYVALIRGDFSLVLRRVLQQN